MSYKFNDAPRYPENDVRITAYYKDEEYKAQFGEDHYGVDMAEPVKTCDIYSVADGEIISVVNPSDKSKLKHISIKHPDLVENQMCYTRYFHLSGIAPGIEVGKKVKKGELIAYQGKSGYATGYHLELQLWVTPPDYLLKSAKDVAKYTVNPLEYLRLYPGQTLTKDPKGEVKRLELPTVTPLEPGTVFECLKENALYYRTAPQVVKDTLVGFLRKNVYNAVELVNNDNNDWAKIVVGDGFYYSALLDGYSKLIEPSGEKWRELYESEIKKNEDLEKRLEDITGEAKETAEKLYKSEMTLAEIRAEMKTVTETVDAINKIL